MLKLIHESHFGVEKCKSRARELLYWPRISSDIESIVSRRVARIWKRGGLFWKSEKCAYDVDSNFHWPWISFRRFVRNLRRNVSETSEIQTFFPPKIRWSPKKKKKGLRQNLGRFFSQVSQVQTSEGGLYSYGGGYFPFFTENRPQKHKIHAFLHTSQANGGGLSPPSPPPGYATDC